MCISHVMTEKYSSKDLLLELRRTSLTWPRIVLMASYMTFIWVFPFARQVLISSSPLYSIFMIGINNANMVDAFWSSNIVEKD